MSNPLTMKSWSPYAVGIGAASELVRLRHSGPPARRFDGVRAYRRPDREGSRARNRTDQRVLRYLALAVDRRTGEGCLTALMLQNRGKSVTDFQTRVAKKSGGRVGSSV